LRGFNVFWISLQALKIGNFRENLPKVSSPSAKYSRFGETLSGDFFDRHCVLGAAAEILSCCCHFNRFDGEFMSACESKYTFEATGSGDLAGATAIQLGAIRNRNIEAAVQFDTDMDRNQFIFIVIVLVCCLILGIAEWAFYEHRYH
jgi:hypothetical protein